MDSEIVNVGKVSPLKKEGRKSFLHISGENSDIKKAIWLYFFFLVFEGALRKWFLPFLATPLLLVRDPIALWAIFKAIKKDLLPPNIYMLVIIPVSIISIFSAVLAGHGSYLVAFYGVRPLLIHLPFIFVMAAVFTRNDTVLMGKVILWIAIPMTVLIALQFYSPQSAWVNKGIGGDEAGGGFSGADGFFRPPATFSFTNGTGLFYCLVGCFVFFFWLNSKLINRLVLIGSTISLIIAIPLSVSRGLLYSLAVVALFVMIGTARKPRYLTKMIGGVIGLVLVFALLSQLSFFQKGTEVLTHRFENASNSEGEEGTQGRYLNSFTKTFYHLEEIPFWGYGAGLYTNVGTKLVSGKVTSGIAEGEVGRMMLELGAVMGTAVIFMRLLLCINLFIKSYRKLVVGDMLPWILLSYALLEGPQANWAQPTSLGFSILITGLVFSALNTKNNNGVKNKYPLLINAEN